MKDFYICDLLDEPKVQSLMFQVYIWLNFNNLHVRLCFNHVRKDPLCIIFQAKKGKNISWTFLGHVLCYCNGFSFLCVCVCVISPDEVPATGTGTLMIQLEDVNDNAPTIEEREIRVRVLSQTLNICCVCKRLHVNLYSKCLVSVQWFLLWDGCGSKCTDVEWNEI